MDGCVAFRLEEEKMDSVLCDSKSLVEILKKNEDKYMKLFEAREILTTHNHTVFVWNAEDSSILSVQLCNSLPKDVSSSLRILLLTTQPLFEVEKININCAGSLLILSGRNGVMIVKLPSTDTLGYLTSVKNEFLCKSWNVAERMFKCSTHVNVKKVAWYPASEYGSYVVILSTDNVFRIFDINEPEISNAEYSSTQNSSDISLPYMSFSACLGENVIDFDFGTSFSEVFNDSHSNRIICPMYVLKGNGEIFFMKTICRCNRVDFSELEGPLTMYPQADDNYGIDAYSLITLSTSPSILVIGMTSGILHHCIVFDNDVAENVPQSNQSSDSISKNSSIESQSNLSLYVYESVELSLSPVRGNNDEENNWFVHLYKDTTESSNYFCTHTSGIYSVHLPLVSFLEVYSSKDDPGLLAHLQGKDCIVEHLVCTQPLPTMDPIPVLGLGIASSHISSFLICLLASWEFLCIPVSPVYKTLYPSLMSLNLMQQDIFSQSLKNSFEHYIHQLIQRSIAAPLLKSVESSNIQSSPQQWLELTTNLTHRFREDYLQILDVIQLQTQRRIKVLQQQKKKQLEDMEQFLKNRESIRDRAAKLAEKYECAFYNHQKLVERIENILHQVQSQLPVLSNAELMMKRELVSTEEKLKNFDISIQQINTKKEYQSKRNTASEVFSSTSSDIKNGEKGKSYITPVQLQYLKTVLGKQGEQISDLKTKIKWLKTEIDNS